MVLATAADAFLATLRTANPNTHRAYASAIDRTIERLGRDRPLADGTAAPPTCCPGSSDSGRQHAHERAGVPVRTPPGPGPSPGGRRHLPAHRPALAWATTAPASCWTSTPA
ncbi:hypothetical protein ABZW49_41590 [Nonomuraea wenchangensis]